MPHQLSSSPRRLCSDLNDVTSTPCKRASDQRQGRAHQHDPGDNVERGRIVRIARCTKASNQYRANNTSCTPRGEHGTVNGSSIFGTKEVGGKGRHGAKAPTVAERNDGCWNQEQGKAGNRWQDGEDDSLNDEHAQEGEGPSNAIREPAPEQASRAIEDANDADQQCRRHRTNTSELLRQWRGYGDQCSTVSDVQCKYQTQ